MNVVILKTKALELSVLRLIRITSVACYTPISTPGPKHTHAHTLTGVRAHADSLMPEVWARDFHLNKCFWKLTQVHKPHFWKPCRALEGRVF